MLKQITFGDILTVIGYGVKKIYNKLSKSKINSDTPFTIIPSQENIEFEEFKLKRDFKIKQKKNQIQEFLCECMKCYNGFSKYFNSKEFLELEQKFTFNNNYKIELLFNFYKKQMIKMIK